MVEQPVERPSTDPLGWLADAARDRRAAGLERRPRVRTADATAAVLDLAGNDYLGLSRHPAVVEAAVTALRSWGAGSTGSRLVSGSTTEHAELEAALADFCGAADAAVTSSGYLANLAAVTALAPGPDHLVVSDRSAHASLIDACRLSRARIVVVPAHDVAAVAAALAARPERGALVVTDAVDSTDGQVAPLRDLHAVARRHGAVLLADEAHALGVVGPGGRGAVAAAGLAGEPDVLATATLSKALGGQGGAILGRRDAVEHVRQVGRGYVFDTALAPASAAAALAALRLVRADPGLPARALARAAALAAAAGVPASTSAVVPWLVGDPRLAVRAQAEAAGAGVAVGCFRPPTVPAGTARLRITARADLTDAEVDRAAAAFAAVRALLAREGLSPPAPVPG